jgi:sugar lactone lactonase YvrE
MTTGLYCLSIDAEHFELLANSMPPNLRQRYNDAKCDASGRLWCGTMSLFGRTTEGALYQVRGDGSRQTVLQDIGISNGLAWSQDNKTMYYIDSMTYGVDAFNFNLQKGLISERRRVIDISSGLPDGMTIDAEGMLWVAIWGESCVRRYNPIDGALLDIVEIPSKFVTSCCFGGVDMDTLYITTSAEREMENKGAGCVYCLKPGVKGFPSVPFDDIERMN